MLIYHDERKARERLHARLVVARANDLAQAERQARQAASNAYWQRVREEVTEQAQPVEDKPLAVYAEAVLAKMYGRKPPEAKK
jgi:hypothetical protein